MGEQNDEKEIDDDAMDFDEFARDLAAIAAKQLIKQSAVNGRVTTDDVIRLQDCTSLFSPYTFDHVMVQLRNAGAQVVDNDYTQRIPPNEASNDRSGDDGRKKKRGHHINRRRSV